MINIECISGRHCFARVSVIIKVLSLPTNSSWRFFRFFQSIFAVLGKEQLIAEIRKKKISTVIELYKKKVTKLIEYKRLTYKTNTGPIGIFKVERTN